MKNNHEMTIKIPRCVHKSLKALAVAHELPMYAVLAKLILTDLSDLDRNHYEMNEERKRII